MTTFLFCIIILALFAALFTYEAQREPQGQKRLTPSLLAWLISGNWPAKIGAILMIIGLGALLRYAMLNIAVPPEVKLGSGVGAGIVLFAAAYFLRLRYRALALALTGAALAVLHLTAYSAYALFGYLPDTTTFAALAGLCVAGCLFALQMNVLSIAILSLLGAYLAPYFAFHQPDTILIVYFYYLALSLSCLMLIMRRGWHSLMQLSLLFTLAGGGLFEWDISFYDSVSLTTNMLMLWGLVALQLAMPIADAYHNAKVSGTKPPRHAAYLCILAALAGGITYALTPTGFLASTFNAASRDHLVVPLHDAMINTLAYTLHISWPRAANALGFSVLALLWFAASRIGRLLQQADALPNALIGVVFVLLAICFALPGLPWILLLLVFATLLLIEAPRFRLDAQQQALLCIVLIALGVMHMVDSTMGDMVAPHVVFLARIIAAAALLVAGHVASKRRLTQATILIWFGVIWAVLAVLREAIDNFSPAMISLALAVIGASLMVWAHRVGRRSLWSLGAVVLGMAACKLIFFDIGSLRQLENIIAMILTGAVFLGISVLAPFPPAAPTSEAAKAPLPPPDASLPALLPATRFILVGLFAASLLLLAFKLSALEPESAHTLTALRDDGPAPPQQPLSRQMRSGARMGMSWGVIPEQTAKSPLLTLVSCYGKPAVSAAQSGCDAYHGDTSCQKFLPLLCVVPIHQTDVTLPVQATDQSSAWSSERIFLTEPMPGTRLTSRDEGDSICAKHFGRKWRMAEFHDGGGWGFWANGKIPAATRFWVAINDQPANCWDMR